MRSPARDTEIAQIPWVSRFSGDKPCDGIKWNQAALKHLFSMGGRPPEGIPYRARCKLHAKWHFTALPNEDPGITGYTGDYCIHHLFTQVFGHQRELDRYQKWAAGELEDTLKEGHHA